jgi:septum site-determining protein MinC
MAAQKNNVSRPCQFKGSLFTLTVLHLYTNDLEQIKQEMIATVQRAPQFFKMAPVVLDISSLATDTIDFVSLASCLRTLGLLPVGVRGAREELTSLISNASLALLPSSSTTTEASPTPTTKKSSAPQKNLIVDQPIRSGQQVYAKEGDLIIIGSVSPGAELLADGSIHVYGTLRGRALAGIHGNQQARIFCHTMAAELLSIAGIYQLSEDFAAFQEKQSLQIYLENDRLVLKTYK